MPRKNLLEFAGKPMIAHAIETCQRSASIKRVYVSTEDEEIASVSQQFGAEVPFLRPKSLADDFTTIVKVMGHFLRELDERGCTVQNACCVFACTPLLRAETIDKTFEMFVESDFGFAYPVVQYSHPIQRSMRMARDGGMSYLFPENELTRTQDLEATYHDAGQFYWGEKDRWISSERIHSSGLGIEVEALSTVDIDTMGDLSLAQRLYGQKGSL